MLIIFVYAWFPDRENRRGVVPNLREVDADHVIVEVCNVVKSHLD